VPELEFPDHVREEKKRDKEKKRDRSDERAKRRMTRSKWESPVQSFESALVRPPTYLTHPPFLWLDSYLTCPSLARFRPSFLFILDLSALGRQEEWEEPKGRTTGLGATAGGDKIPYPDELQRVKICLSRQIDGDSSHSGGTAKNRVAESSRLRLK
jgi:hypothetical protein